MAATSVTGLGLGSDPNRGETYIGFSKIIGPRWDEKKEKQFNNMGMFIWGLVFTQSLSVFAIIALFLK